MPAVSTIRTWRDALAQLDLEQHDLVQAVTADPTKPITEVSRGRSASDAERILGEAMTYIGRRLIDQARAATDGRGRP